jgi:hypothetical protein
MKNKVVHIKYSPDKVEKVVSGRIKTVNGDQLAELQLEYERQLLGIYESADKSLDNEQSSEKKD